MKLTNISNKIISVGTTVVMPGDEITITEQEANLPSIKSLEGHGFLKIENAFELKKEEDSEEKVAEENTEEPQKQPRKRGMNKISKE